MKRKELEPAKPRTEEEICHYQSGVVIEPRFPKYQWGQRVRLYSIFTMMAHIQISRGGAAGQEW